MGLIIACAFTYQHIDMNATAFHECKLTYSAKVFAGASPMFGTAIRKTLPLLDARSWDRTYTGSCE
jgi:hypothetical protein